MMSPVAIITGRIQGNERVYCVLQLQKEILFLHARRYDKVSIAGDIMMSGDVLRDINSFIQR